MGSLWGDFGSAVIFDSIRCQFSGYAIIFSIVALLRGRFVKLWAIFGPFLGIFDPPLFFCQFQTIFTVIMRFFGDILRSRMHN